MPDYKHGMQSRVREELVLHMLAEEQEASLMESQLLYTTLTIAPHLRQDAVSERVSAVNDLAKFIVNKKEYNNAKYETAEDKLRSAGDNMIKAWKQFANSATMTAFTKLAKKKFKEVTTGISNVFTKS